MSAENGIKVCLKVIPCRGKHYVSLYITSGHLSTNKTIGWLNESDPCNLLQLVIIASAQLKKIDDIYALRQADKSWRHDRKIGRPPGKRQPGSRHESASQDRTTGRQTPARIAARIRQPGSDAQHTNASQDRGRPRRSK